MPRLFVHAINVHQGGGAVLLCDLLRAIPPDIEAIVHVDARMGVLADLPDHVRVERIEPTLLGRFAAERRLADTVTPNDQVLCFGNLPPLFRLRGEAVVFLQNRYLVDPCAPLGALPLKPRIRLWLERAWLRGRRLNADWYIVQTPSMQRLAAQQLGVEVSCTPFVPVGVLDQTGGRTGCARVAQAAARGLRIQNVGVLSHERVLAMYRASGALIYPSSFESFGLPLLEARQAGLPVLAPELDYVRDVTDPDETFDPRSPISIARAVRRYLDGRTQAPEPRGAEALLGYVLARKVS